MSPVLKNLPAYDDDNKLMQDLVFKYQQILQRIKYSEFTDYYHIAV